MVSRSMPMPTPPPEACRLERAKLVGVVARNLVVAPMSWPRPAFGSARPESTRWLKPLEGVGVLVAADEQLEKLDKLRGCSAASWPAGRSPADAHLTNAGRMSFSSATASEDLSEMSLPACPQASSARPPFFGMAAGHSRLRSKPLRRRGLRYRATAIQRSLLTGRCRRPGS